MSDVYSEHIAILKGQLLSQQWLKQSSVGLSKQTFSTCMDLASTLVIGARAMVDTSACSLKCLNKRMKIPALTHSTRIVLKTVMT